MALETKLLGKAKNFGRKFLLGTLAVGALSFGSCNKVDVNSPDEITIDPKHVGMVQGKTLSAKIGASNGILFSGYSGAEVKLYTPDNEQTNFKTTSVSGGAYAIDNIPTGSYNVWAWGSHAGDHVPAIVSSQQTYNVEDLIVAIDKIDKEGIIYGKVKRGDGSPYANKTIELWDADRTASGTFPARKESSTTTSSDGSYSFYFRSDEYYLKSLEGNLQVGSWTPVGYFDPVRILGWNGENVKGPLINQEVTFIPL